MIVCPSLQTLPDAFLLLLNMTVTPGWCVVVFSGCSAQHWWRLPGLLPWWPVTLWAGESCPQDQPGGDSGAFRPLRRNSQTTQEHQQCQVTFCIAARGQCAPSRYTTVAARAEIEFRFSSAGSFFLGAGNHCGLSEKPTWRWSSTCRPQQGWLGFM